MGHLWVQTLRASEAELSEHFAHRNVLREDIGSQSFQARGSCKIYEMPRQQCTNALPLIGIDYDEGDLGFAGLGHDVASAADDGERTALLDFRDERDMIDKVDVHEEGLFLLRKSPSGHEEAAPQRLRVGTIDRCEHLGLVVGPQCADLDRSA